MLLRAGEQHTVDKLSSTYSGFSAKQAAKVSRTVSEKLCTILRAKRGGRVYSYPFGDLVKELASAINTAVKLGQRKEQISKHALCAIVRVLSAEHTYMKQTSEKIVACAVFHKGR